jgi:hypothetical protein
MDENKLPAEYEPKVLSKSQAGRTLLRTALDAVVAEQRADEAHQAFNNTVDKNMPGANKAAMLDRPPEQRKAARNSTVALLGVAAFSSTGFVLTTTAVGMTAVNAIFDKPLLDSSEAVFAPTGITAVDGVLGASALYAGFKAARKSATLERTGRIDKAAAALVEENNKAEASAALIPSHVQLFAETELGEPVSNEDAIWIASALETEVAAHQKTVERVVLRNKGLETGDQGLD